MKLYCIGTQKGGTTFIRNVINKNSNCLGFETENQVIIDKTGNGRGKFGEVIFDYNEYLDSCTTDDPTFFYVHIAPCFFVSPLAAERITKMFPNTKIIIALRNPVYRFLSMVKMEIQISIELNMFPDKVKDKIFFKRNQLKNYLENTKFDFENYPNLDWGIQEGMYYDSLKLWLKYVKPEQLCIIDFSYLKKHPLEVFKEIYNFADIPLPSDKELLDHIENAVKIPEKERILSNTQVNHQLKTFISNQDLIDLRDFYKTRNRYFRNLVIKNKIKWLGENPGIFMSEN